MSLLFEPMSLRGLQIRNRVWLPAMCQYSCFAGDGVPTDWHLVHLGARAAGGFGLIITEATAVAPEGRISPQDTGLWNDTQAEAWGRIVEFVHDRGAAIGVQLAHAGRKASTYGIEPTGTGTVPESEGGWEPLGPGALPFEGYAAPRAMSLDEIAAIPGQFATAARRALEVGFDTVEIHAAHGYLLHQFLSPLINDRSDAYGGSFENRTRLVVEVVDAVRDVWPDDLPVLIRVSATDWADGGWDVDETTELARILGSHGIDLVDVSTGGAVAHQRIEVGPGYQVPHAAKVREGSGLPVAAVGLITQPSQAEQILVDEHADVVLLGREGLRDALWPLRAAHELGLDPSVAPWPAQYVRAHFH